MKWYTYLICYVLIVVGAFCGVQFYRKVKAESYINGSIDISNQFVQEDFNYTSSGISFYHDVYDETDTYSFETNLLVVNDFDGLNKEYELYLNEHYLMNYKFGAGYISGIAYIDFYDIYGNVVCNSSLNIFIKFLSDNTSLLLSTTGKDNAGFLEQYFSNNGIRLIVNKII